MTPAEARAWYEQQQACGADPSRRYWVIEAEGHLVGGAGLDSLKPSDRKAHLVIGMFAPSHMRRGLGTEAARPVLAHAFGSLNPRGPTSPRVQRRRHRLLPQVRLRAGGPRTGQLLVRRPLA